MKRKEIELLERAYKELKEFVDWIAKNHPETYEKIAKEYMEYQKHKEVER